MTLFVTGTGTGVGKTWVSCGILRREGGRGLKPVMSGYDEADMAGSDAGQLLSANGLAVTGENIAGISPWRFAAPLSPDMAAAREGRIIPFDDLVAFCRQPGVKLIEGVGGVAVPLDDRRTVLDWMAALGFPVLLVAGSYLGTLSHTLTAVMALRQYGLRLAGIVVNETEGSTVGLDETIATLGRQCDAPVHAMRRGETLFR